MSLKPAMFLTSALVGAGLLVTPLTAQAGGMTHMGTFGGHVGNVGVQNTINCNQGVSLGHPVQVSRPSYINNISVYKPVNINKSVNVNKPVSITKNIDNSKNIDVNKPVSVTKNIDASKNIDINKPVSITKNIDNSKNISIVKNIDDSKNININKKIIINKGGSEADASAIAAAVAAAAANASASATVNLSGSSSASSNAGATVFVGGSVITDTPGQYAGGDIGALAVDVQAPPAQCSFQSATVVKAIHAICFTADGHQFPASHMIGDTWIKNGYEGEVARCLPGAQLKVSIGSVVQSDQGMATSTVNAATLTCGPHEAVRHYKDGMLKCAPVVPVPDCTERTNLRKWGSGDMFFSYVTKVCLEQSRELIGGQSHEAVDESESGRQQETTSQSERDTVLRGITLGGGVGYGSY